jgi:mono/diheme cytochrome c family protein
MSRASVLLLGIAVMGPAALRAQDSAAPDTAALIALGRTIFEGRGLCFSCHGKTGDGVLGPTTRLAGRPLTHTKPTIPDLVALIKLGVDSAHSTSGQVMPPRGGSRISDDQVEAVAWYVLELQRSALPQKP